MIKIKNNLAGRKFNLLTVIDLDVCRTEKTNKSYWFCRCECGNIKSARGSSLVSGDIKSCGCLKREYHDLSGKKFNCLTVIGLDIDKTEMKQKYWLCRCDCGNEKSARGDSILNGSIRSCGCLKKYQDKINLGTSTHKLSKTRCYSIWNHMKARCYNPNSKKYKVYGSRGIRICDDWIDNFTNFYNWAMNNGYSDELSIDRINVNGNYEPSNCRWATFKEQATNKQDTIYLTIKGEKKAFKEWCGIYDINYKLAHSRLKKYGVEDIDKIFYQGNLNQKNKKGEK